MSYEFAEHGRFGNVRTGRYHYELECCKCGKTKERVGR